MSWLFLVRLLEGFGKPMTYSFQRVLPTLPVPPLHATCRRYLESARPLLDDAEYDRMCRLADEFQQNEGKGFQRWLNLKSWCVSSNACSHARAAVVVTTRPLILAWLTPLVRVVSNYVSDWWERFVYLRSRDSLMINSNYYIMDAYSWSPTSQQTARAANMISMMMLYKVGAAPAWNPLCSACLLICVGCCLACLPMTCADAMHSQRKLDRCEIEPLMVQGTVPLCMSQHERTFGTTRIPCKDEGACPSPTLALPMPWPLDLASWLPL